MLRVLAQAGESIDIYGLGIIAAALVVGQTMAFRFIVEPERKRNDESVKAMRVQHSAVIRELTSRQDERVVALEARNERQAEEIRRLNDMQADKWVPALIAATVATTESQNLIRMLQTEFEAGKRRGVSPSD